MFPSTKTDEMGGDAARFREHETARPTLVVCLLEGVSEDLWAFGPAGLAGGPEIPRAAREM